MSGKATHRAAELWICSRVRVGNVGLSKCLRKRRRLSFVVRSFAQSAGTHRPRGHKLRLPFFELEDLDGETYTVHWMELCCRRSRRDQRNGSRPLNMATACHLRTDLSATKTSVSADFFELRSADDRRRQVTAALHRKPRAALRVRLAMCFCM